MGHAEAGQGEAMKLIGLVFSGIIAFGIGILDMKAFDAPIYSSFSLSVIIWCLMTTEVNRILDQEKRK